jgi:Protein of unknown function (DUF1761)
VFLAAIEEVAVRIPDPNLANQLQMKGQLVHRTSYLAVVVAAVAAFVASLVWYTVFGNAMMELRGVDPATAAEVATPIWTMLFVVAQSLVVALMLAYFVAQLGITSLRGAVRLGALVWVFPAMILLGSVVHENVPFMLAAIHAGDWLVKLLLMAVILGVWRVKPTTTEAARA